MKQKYNLVIEKDKESGWFVGEVVELPGCYSQGATIEDLLHNIKEAITVYLETSSEESCITEYMGTFCLEV